MATRELVLQLQFNPVMVSNKVAGVLLGFLFGLLGVFCYCFCLFVLVCCGFCLFVVFLEGLCVWFFVGFFVVFLTMTS